MKYIVSSILSIVGLAFAVPGSAVFATPITVPAGLNPGDHYRLVFVTSTSRDGTSTNIADYNAFVTTAANSVPQLAALSTTWTAIASTATVNARDNTGTNPVATGVPIYNLAGLEVATNNTTLWTSTLTVTHLAAINANESGTIVPTGVTVWTGTNLAGTKTAVPLGPGTSVGYGNAANTDALWILNVFGSATTTSRSFYAISGDLKVVPEPSSVLLACLGLAVALIRVCRS